MTDQDRMEVDYISGDWPPLLRDCERSADSETKEYVREIV